MFHEISSILDITARKPHRIKIAGEMGLNRQTIDICESKEKSEAIFREVSQHFPALKFQRFVDVLSAAECKDILQIICKHLHLSVVKS